MFPTASVRHHAPLHASSLAHDAPAPGTRLTRLRGGTHSPTVGRLRLSDGSLVLTDLIRLNPDVDAYSLDFHGASPRHAAHYEVAEAGAGRPAIARAARELSWILANSYPAVDTAELSRRVRAAGYPIGSADLRVHDAIAATQAALWSFTDGVALSRGDDGGRMPVDVVVAPGEPARLPLPGADGARLTAYAVRLTGPVPSDLSLSLERSRDGRSWHPVAGSAVSPGEVEHEIVKGLGLAATTAWSRGATAHGYAQYRVAVTTRRTSALVEVASVRAVRADVRRDENPAAVLHLYDHLLEGANAADEDALRGATSVLRIGASDIGPFLLDHGVGGRYLVRAADESGRPVGVLDADGHPVDGPLHGDAAFRLAPPPGDGGRIRLAIDVEDAYEHTVRLLVGNCAGTGAPLTTLGIPARVAAAPRRVVRTISWRDVGAASARTTAAL